MRSMAVVIRFIKNLRSKQRGKLELDAFYEARIYLFRKSKEKSFKDAIKDMKQHRSLSKKDRLLCLSPSFENGLLRVCGRTKQSSLPFDAKHPIILDTKEHSIQLYIQKCYEICMHIGVEYTRNYIQQRCHLLGVRIFLRSLALNVSTVAASERRDYSHRWQTCQTFVSRKHSHQSSSPRSAWNTLDLLPLFIKMQK